MDKNNFNARFRLFLESIEEERQLNELAGSGDEMDFNTIGRGTASSTELASDARTAASTNAFSNKEWSSQEKAIFRRTNGMLRYMIENGDIVRIVPDLKMFMKNCFKKLALKLPGSQEAETNTKPGEASLSIGGKPVK